MIDKIALDKYMQNVLEQHKIAGMSVAVTDKEGIVYSNGFGVESVEIHTFCPHRKRFIKLLQSRKCSTQSISCACWIRDYWNWMCR